LYTSPLPGCVDDVLSVESDVDSLVVVVSEVVVTVTAVVCGRAVHKQPNNINEQDASLYTVFQKSSPFLFSL